MCGNRLPTDLAWGARQCVIGAGWSPGRSRGGLAAVARWRAGEKKVTNSAGVGYVLVMMSRLPLCPLERRAVPVTRIIRNKDTGTRRRAGGRARALVPAGLMIGVLAVFGVAGAVAGEPTHTFVRKQIARGQPLELRAFGGPDRAVYIRARQMSFVTVEIVDLSRKVPVVCEGLRETVIDGAGTAYLGSRQDRIVWVSPKETVRVEKKGGEFFPGTNSRMYQVFADDATGVRVYFLDAIAAQNQDLLVVAVPRAAH